MADKLPLASWLALAPWVTVSTPMRTYQAGIWKSVTPMLVIHPSTPKNLQQSISGNIKYCFVSDLYSGTSGKFYADE